MRKGQHYGRQIHKRKWQECNLPHKHHNNNRTRIQKRIVATMTRAHQRNKKGRNLFRRNFPEALQYPMQMMKLSNRLLIVQQAMEQQPSTPSTDAGGGEPLMTSGEVEANAGSP